MSVRLVDILKDAETPLEGVKCLRNWLEDKGFTEAAAAVHEETWVGVGDSDYWKARYQEVYDEGYEEGKAAGWDEAATKAELEEEALP